MALLEVIRWVPHSFVWKAISILVQNLFTVPTQNEQLACRVSQFLSERCLGHQSLLIHLIFVCIYIHVSGGLFPLPRSL